MTRPTERATSASSGVQVVEVADHVEVAGASAEDVELALDLLAAVTELKRASRDGLLQQLTTAMLSRRLPLVPEATQRQAQRAAALREHLLDRGYETHASLASLTHRREGAVRTWVTRQRARGLFTVLVGGQTAIPSVQLDDRGSLRRQVAPLVTTLRGAGLEGWELWAWLCGPTDLLSGEEPGEVARREPERALRAAERHAGQVLLGADTTA